MFLNLPGFSNPLIFGQAQAEAGSASAPSYSFSSDLDSGMYSGGANILTFSTGGSERIRIGSSGNVIIGDSTITTSLSFEVVTKTQANTAMFTAYGFATAVLGRRANGTISSPSAVLSGETIVTFGARGYGATAFSAGRGSFRVAASENWTDSAQGTYLEFLTTNTGGTTTASKLKLKATGQLRFVPLAADPSDAETGDVYYNSSTNKLRVYNGAWVDLH